MNSHKLLTRTAAAIVVLLLLLFFTNDFGLIDIQKTSIITAVGIDAADNGRLNITAQIAVPESSGTGKSVNVTVQNAANVGDAIAELNMKTGWYPTLVHCRLVLLGDKLARRDVFGVLDYFLRSRFVEASCLLAVCDGRAETILTAKSPVGDMTYSAVQKVLSSEAQKTGLVSVNNLREFAKSYYSPAKSGFLPLLSVKQEAKGEREQQGNGEKENNSAQDSGVGSDIFDASRTALFFNGRMQGIFSADETLAFNLAESSAAAAYANVTVQHNGEPATYSLRIQISKKQTRTAEQNGIPMITFRLRAHARITDVNQSQSATDVAKTDIVPPFVLRAAEGRAVQELASAFEKARLLRCDVFGVCKQLRRHNPRLFERIGFGALERVRAEYDIRFDSAH